MAHPGVRARPGLIPPGRRAAGHRWLACKPPLLAPVARTAEARSAARSPLPVTATINSARNPVATSIAGPKSIRVDEKPMIVIAMIWRNPRSTPESGTLHGWQRSGSPPETEIGHPRTGTTSPRRRLRPRHKPGRRPWERPPIKGSTPRRPPAQRWQYRMRPGQRNERIPEPQEVGIACQHEQGDGRTAAAAPGRPGSMAATTPSSMIAAVRNRRPGSRRRSASRAVSKARPTNAAVVSQPRTNEMAISDIDSRGSPHPVKIGRACSRMVASQPGPTGRLWSQSCATMTTLLLHGCFRHLLDFLRLWDA